MDVKFEIKNTTKAVEMVITADFPAAGPYHFLFSQSEFDLFTQKVIGTFQAVKDYEAHRGESILRERALMAAGVDITDDGTCYACGDKQPSVQTRKLGHNEHADLCSDCWSKVQKGAL